ncbi:hypothetical protein BHM03_00041669 [Ensete ventricosum]|nr:hypothetical protein BHM03_00041669 [Ensete ventricosum]
MKFFSRQLFRLRGSVGLSDLRELSVDVLVLRRSKADQQTAFELPSRRDSLSAFNPIIPLNDVSFKVDGSDLHHGSLRGPIIMEVALRARKPSRRVSIFPTREVHLVCRCWIHCVFFFPWRVPFAIWTLALLRSRRAQ